MTFIVYIFFNHASSWLCGWQCQSDSHLVSRPTIWVQTEISQQLLDGLPWTVVEISIAPRGWVLVTLMIPWPFTYCHQLKFTFTHLVKYLIIHLVDGLAQIWVQIMSRQLLDGILCSFVNFGGPMTFNLAQSTGQNFNLSNTFSLCTAVWFSLQWALQPHRATSRAVECWGVFTKPVANYHQGYKILRKPNLSN